MTSTISRRSALAGVLAIAQIPGASGAEKSPAGPIKLRLRSRVEAFKGSGEWQEVHFEKELAPAETAILICDMWDDHWCKGAAGRVGVMVKSMAPVLERARARGVQIIHSPSNVMEFYKDYPQRRRMMELPKMDPPAILALTDPPLPIDDAKGGCDTGEKFYKAWTRQQAGLRIAPEDAISDDGAEIYSLIRQKNVQTLLVMGVHTNMCVLNRTFAIRQMTKWGVRCILVRDLTDSMYDPKERPFVAHAQGTELVIQHIEKYWCPTTLSSGLSA